MNIRELFDGFARVEKKQQRHGYGFPSTKGLKSEALRWVVTSPSSKKRIVRARPEDRSEIVRRALSDRDRRARKAVARRRRRERERRTA